MMAQTHLQKDSEKGSPGAVLVGTSGYSYDDWVGRFYPDKMKKDQFLSHYAKHFSTVEINYTYYRMPTEKVMSGMLKKSDGKVEFVLKLHQDMTHTRSSKKEDYQYFQQAVAPLEQNGVLGSFLAQFPYSFHPTKENENYLRKLRDFLPDNDVVVELRNSGWVKQSTFDLLKEVDFGFCCVDEPRITGLMPALAVATSKTGYVRFHGRNKEKWYKHDRPEERYDYRYTRQELEPWADKIKKLAKLTSKVYCFHNNHYQSKAVESAQLLIDLIRH